MKLSVDSSAFAKRYVLENGSETIDDLLQKASQLALCTILVPEIISGLNRRLREKNLSLHDYRKVKKQLLEDIHDSVVLQITPAALLKHSFRHHRYLCRRSIPSRWLPYHRHDRHFYQTR